MTARIALAVLLLLLLSGCAFGDDSAAERRVEKCLARFAADADPEFHVLGDCELFEERGWIHDDGTLRLEAYAESDSRACSFVGPDETVDIPCEDVNGPLLDCYLLDKVRRSEVIAYVTRRGGVECADGTSLLELGS